MDNFRGAKYRPDIDGLRAIAVLSVVLFHLDKKLIPGGFVGVDIFFVISGYLITLISYSEMRNNTFSFSGFYRRRINRIMPALLVVIVSVLIFGLIALPPMDLTKLFKGAVAATAAVSNVYFWREYGNYFNAGIDEAPLLHTWSLGVEEQFYFMWPVLLLGLARTRVVLRSVIFVAGLASAVLISEIGTRTAASASYYLLPTRFFELAIGSLLAILVFEKPIPLNRKIATISGIVGLVLIFGSLYFLSETSPFPGVYALYPCIGTALLIAAGSNPDILTTRLLSLKPIVLIGLISYSFYLWHWPLIAYANYFDIQVTLLSRAAIFVASILLAWLSWKFIEVPFRTSGSVMKFNAILTRRYVGPFTTIALASFIVIQSKGFPERFDPRVADYERIINTAPEKLYEQCHSSTFFYRREPNASCILGNPARSPELFLIGDSFANHFSGMVDVLAKQDGFTVMHYTMDGCLPVKGLGFGTAPSYMEKCRLRNDFSYQYIARRGFKYVLLGGSWPNDGSSESFARLQQGLQNSIFSIISSGAKPIIILNNQMTNRADCPVRQLLMNSGKSCDEAPHPNGKQWRMFQLLKKEFPELIFIDPNKVICWQNKCHSIIDKVPLYRDSAHLNDVGSRLIGRMLIGKGIHLTQGDASPSLFESTDTMTHNERP
ncbi:MAG: acyltransferase family protein [Massilia sp.]